MTSRLICASVLLAATALADGPADNVPDQVRRIPPAGIEVAEAERSSLQAELDQLAEAMAEIREHPLLPDVEVFHKAVRYALDYGEFQKPAELELAHAQLALGMERAASLKSHRAPWTRQKGLVVRGFRSKIDGSVQPYGLVVPDSYQFTGTHKHRLDFWFHGRGERVNEIAFIQQRMNSRGEYTPADTIMLHPYARYSNANKFAGEIDCLEALEHVKSSYRIDPDRILVRGFSMGGAACWQFAIHYADRWCAANPGAGFAETPEFLKFFQGETLDPSAWERRLWHLYDCTDYALNLSNLPTVAYSGELDKQKQAADIMAEAMLDHGLTLTHVIGPETAHKIHPLSKQDIASRLDSIAEVGRERLPPFVQLETYTLRYNRAYWLTIDRMEEHWVRAVVRASYSPIGIRFLDAENVSALSVSFPAGTCPLIRNQKPIIQIAGQKLEAPGVGSDLSWQVQIVREGKRWKIGTPPVALVKRHGLQGPIDDAFMDSFLFVAPSGSGAGEGAFPAWERAERSRAITHWRQQFRGDACVKGDTELSDADIADHNLVLWGDPTSNAIIAKIAGQLPIRWDAEAIRVGGQSYDASNHALIMIYPNPLNPDRYVVLNSSFTYREYDYLNNARQVPKLPDWAIIDLSEAPGSQRPGRIAAAGFFDEAWQLR